MRRVWLALCVLWSAGVMAADPRWIDVAMLPPLPPRPAAMPYGTSDPADEQRLVQAASDRLDRTRIRAPVAGEVVDLKLRTVGGVVNPGEPLMDLVPRDQPLVIEARVSPRDIDVVHPGLKADVHLTAFHTRYLARVQGEVRQVSADRLTDPKTGEPYYTAQIYVDMAEIQKKTPEVKLSPGMPAEAMIITGERTAFEYLIQPIRNTFRRSLRET